MNPSPCSSPNLTIPTSTLSTPTFPTTNSLSQTSNTSTQNLHNSNFSTPPPAPSPTASTASDSSYANQLCQQNFCFCWKSRKSKNPKVKNRKCIASEVVKMIPSLNGADELLQGPKKWENLLKTLSTSNLPETDIKTAVKYLYRKLKTDKKCFSLISSIINDSSLSPSQNLSPVPHLSVDLDLEISDEVQEILVKAGEFATMFQDLVRQYAVVPCFICDRTLYPNGRTTAFITDKTQELMMELNTSLTEEDFDDRVTLCWRCAGWNSAGKLHAQCKFNDLIPEEIPVEIQRLSEVALQIISQIRPFLKIHRLSCRDGQLALRGNAIYFPLCVEGILEQLPLKSCESDIIIIIEALENLKNIRQFAISPQFIESALEWLKKNNHLYSHITISQENLANLKLDDMVVTIPESYKNPTPDAGHLSIGKQVGFIRMNEKYADSGEILRGTIHQGNNNFPADTRGRQCSCMSVTAIAYSIIQSPETWTRATVDEILITGNQHFRIQNEIRDEKVKEVFMLVSEAVGTVQNVFGKIKVNVETDDENVITGAMSKLKSKEKITRMPEALAEFLDSGKNAAAVCAGGYTMALIVPNDDVFLFDSHSRGEKGHQTAGENGTACVIKFSKSVAAQKLSRIIQVNCQPKTNPQPEMTYEQENLYMFSITPLSAKISSPEPETDNESVDDDDSSIQSDDDDGNEPPRKRIKISSSSSVKRSCDSDSENESPTKIPKLTPASEPKSSESDNNNNNNDDEEPPTKKMKFLSAMDEITKNPIRDTLMHSIDYREPKKEEFLKPTSTFSLNRKTGKPVNLKLEQRYEELAFVNLFPTGLYGINHPRKIRITPLEYVQQRLMSTDNRFSTPSYLFHSLCAVENWKINQKISVCCDMMQKQEERNNNNDNGDDSYDPGNVHLVLKSIRGTSSYWSSYSSDVIAMIKMLGPATFFLTFSYDGMNSWDSINAMLKARFGFQLPDRDPKDMSYAEKQDLLNSNPVAAARHFNYRVKKFFGILKNHSKEIFGHELVDFTYRVEFQLRGSPHVHSILWLRDVPPVGTPEYLKFLDRNISCPLSTPQKDLVLRHQVHHHTSTCFKKENSTSCRFGYPRKVMEKTRILTDDEIEKNRGKFVELERKSDEIFVNNYHPILLEMLRSNMDIQPITNIKAIAYYIAKYMSKSEPEEIRKELQTALERAKTIDSSSQKIKLQQQTRKIMSMREVSEQEAAYRLCPLTLHESSRETIFIPAFKKECNVAKALMLLLVVGERPRCDDVTTEAK